MPGFAGISPYVGSWPESIALATTDQKHPLGTRLTAYDTNGFFGSGEFIYAKTVPAIVQTGRVLIAPDYDGTVTDHLLATVNSGFPLCVAMGPMAANSFGWFQLMGLLVMQAQASVAAGVALGMGANGQVGANTAGKQILGGRVSQPSTFAVTKPTGSRSQMGPKAISVPDIAGLVVGLTVSGTGIAGGSKITQIDTNGTTLNLDLATTAAVSGTITFTYTGFVIVNAPAGLIAQGAIT